MKVLALIGPSGSGKTSLLRELHRHGVVEVTPSWTTRPPRSHEIGDDVGHRFVAREQFSKLELQGFFLEVVELFGFRYGLPDIKSPSNGRIPAISVRASLLDLVSTHFPNNIVYQIESSLELVRDRIGAREAPPAETQIRLQSYGDELSLGRQLCHRTFRALDPVSEVAEKVIRAIEVDFHSNSADGFTVRTMADESQRT